MIGRALGEFVRKPVAGRALESVRPGLGVLPAILSVLGAAIPVAADAGIPFLTGASKGQQRLDEERARLFSYQGQVAQAEASARTRRNLVIGGAVLLVVAGAGYYLVRRSRSGRRKRGRR